MIEVYLVAYNNIFCVEYQIKTFSLFCKDPHKLIVIDSNCGEYPKNTESKREICKKHNVEFLELPVHLSNKRLNPSDILAKKLNYVFYEIIKKREPAFFAFLDQDFFAFREFSVMDQLEKYGMYGDVNEISWDRTPGEKIENLTDGPWCMHPWLSFYKYDLVKDKPMDWSPCKGFDTGGKNWEVFISKSGLKKKDYWRRDTIIMYYPFYDVSNADPAGDEKYYFKWNGQMIYGQVQIYDGKFIHMLNSKFLDDPLNPKTSWCKGFLDLALLESGGISFEYANGFYNNGPAQKI